MTPARKTLYSFLALLIGGLAFFSSQAKLPVVDEVTDRYFTDALQNATIAYASLRGVNAVVSVLKESSVEVSPAGVGLSVAAGQMLDPVDDMTERASDVVVMALVSLGIQKIGYEIGLVLSMQLLALLVILMLPFIWIGKIKHPMMVAMLKVAMILIVVRFMLPVFAGISVWAHQGYFQPQQEQVLENLSFMSDQQISFSDYLSNQQEEQGWWSRLYSEKSQSAEWFQTLGEVAGQLDDIIAALLQLMMLFIVEWLLQVIILPLLGLWLLYQLLQIPLFKPDSAS